MSYYDNRPRFFTDGACRRNGQSDSSGACAYYLNEGCKKSWTDPTTPSTNQSCELGAIYGAIRRAWHCDFQSIVVCTDSEYSINCLTLWPDNNWRPNADDDGTWRNNRGWPVANQDLIKKILANMENVEVIFEKFDTRKKCLFHSGGVRACLRSYRNRRQRACRPNGAGCP